MSKIKLFLPLVFLTQVLFGQSTWLELRDQGANYYDIKAAFTRQYGSKMKEFNRELRKEALSNRPKTDKFERQMEGMIQFMRWSQFIEPRVKESQGNIGSISESVARALTQQNGQATSRTGASWTVKGPINTPTGGGNGRINAVRAHPTIAGTLFACSPAGGLWKSTNSGTSWAAITDAIAILGATDVAFDPTNPNIMYLATGDGEAGDTYSTGVYKSIDGGTTWAVTGLSAVVSSGKTFSKLLVNPTDGSILVGGNAGIYRSTNGGTSWTQVSTLSVRDLEFSPSTPTVVYAGGYGANIFLRSTNSGASFAAAGTGLPTSGSQRVAVAVTPLDATYVYAFVSNSTDYGFKGLYLSTDGGTTFTLKSSTPNVLGWNASGSDSGGQGWYDLSIAVDPSVKTTIFVGGVNIWKSTTSGASWTCVAHWSGSGAPYVHADNHDLSFIGTTLYAGNDGGVFCSSNGGTTWSDKSSNLAIAQIYGMGTSQTNANLFLTGHQDNGTNLTTNNSTWSEVNGGDGMLCFVDRTNDNQMFSSIYNGALYRSTNGGASFQSIKTISGGGWVTPWLQDPVTAATIYAGGTNVNKSINSGTAWTTISAFSGVGTLVSMSVATTNNQYIIAASGSKIMKTINGGTSWTDITTGVTGSILQVYFDPSNENKIYVGVASYGGASVFCSTNGGTTWTNTSTGLPLVPANCFIRQSNGDMYCGTDIGVYLMSAGTTTWTPFTTGMPGISVRDLHIHVATNKLRVSTFARGVWESPLNSGTAANVAPTVSITSPVTNAAYNAGTSVTINATAADADGTIAKVEFYQGTTLLGTSTVAPYTYTWTNAANGTYALTAKAYDNLNATTTSTAVNITVSTFYDAGISAITTPNGTLSAASVTPSVTLKNFGSQALTSTIITYKIDAGTAATFNWTGSIAAGATATVALPSMTGYTVGAHTFTAQSGLFNGNTDANTANNAFTSNFTYSVNVYDAGISAITTPNGTITASSFTPSVTLKNFGNTTLTSTTITYKVDAGTASTYNWSGSIAAGATATVALSVVTGYATGAHTFTAQTGLANGLTDANTANNAFTSNFTYGITNIYDAGISSITTPSGTINTASITPSVMLMNAGNVPLTSTIITYKIDAGTALTYNWTGSIAAGGSTSVTLPSMTGYTAGAHTFTAQTGLFNGLTDGNTANNAKTGNFTYTVATHDIGISAIATPNGTVTTATVTPSVTLKNFGTTTLTSTTISYKIDAGTASNYTWTGTLAAAATVTVTLPAMTGYTAGAHTFTAQTGLVNGNTDITATNNAFTSNFTYTILAACTNDNETANNTKTGAVTIVSNVAKNSQIGSSTDVDYYTFTTPNGSPKVSLKLTNLPFDYDIYLYAADATTELGVGYLGGTSSETIAYNGSTSTLPATYYVKVVGYQGVFSTTICYNLLLATSSTPFVRAFNGSKVLDKGSIVENLSLYPNPAHDKLTVNFTAAEAKTYAINLYNGVGEQVLVSKTHFDIGENTTTLDVSHLPRGFYVVKVQNGGQNLAQKVIIE